MVIFINFNSLLTFPQCLPPGAGKKEITLVCLFSFNLFTKIMQDTLALMRFSPRATIDQLIWHKMCALLKGLHEK